MQLGASAIRRRLCGVLASAVTRVCAFDRNGSLPVMILALAVQRACDMTQRARSDMSRARLLGTGFGCYAHAIALGHASR
jgi:hypothetical protein